MCVQDIEKVLEPVFFFYKQRRAAGEPFGDFCARVGFDAIRDYTKVRCLLGFTACLSDTRDTIQKVLRGGRMKLLCDCIFSSSHIYQVVTTLRACWAHLHLRRLAEVLSSNLKLSGCQELQRLPGLQQQCTVRNS